MKYLSAFLDVVQRAALVVGALLIVAMVVLMNTEIVSRYLFGRSTLIADEYAGYFFTAITLLCFLPALRSGRFLHVDAVVRRMPGRFQAVLEVVAALIGAAVSAVLAYATYKLAYQSFQFGSVSLQASQTPLMIPQAVMPLGFALLAGAFLECGVVRAARLWRGEAPAGSGHALD